MRFFMQILQIEKDDKDTYSLGPIHGPYDDDEAMNRVMAHLSPKDKVARFLVFEGQIVEVGPKLEEHKTRAVGNLDVQPVFDDPRLRWRLEDGSWSWWNRWRRV